MEIVLIEALLMDNDELIHYGKSLGFITKEQRDLIENKATKLTKGKEIVVCLKGSQGFDGKIIKKA